MKKYIYLFVILTIGFSSCETGTDEEPDKPNIYLDSNGVTIKCEDCKVGDKGKVNGVEYEVVDNGLLRQRLEEGKDLSKVCTSLVTSMMDLFDGFPNFNQPIGNWDVSNVVNMKGMFKDEQTTSSKFNQSIEFWDVEKVTNMNNMFFGCQSFNQPLGKWNVSKVEDMGSMFATTQFNQPIGDWNVNNVTDMNFLFSSTPFNQNISKWCVTKITSEPFGFSDDSLNPQNKPKWGTCPN